MSVIITGIDMPKSCEECPIAYFTEGCYRDECQATKSEIMYAKQILSDCPLKTVEGLIAKIESNIQETTPNCMKNRDFNAGLYIAIEIIKKYCEVEE